MSEDAKSPAIAAVYPWQHTQWQQCCRRLETQTLAHAWLLAGQSGLGKLEFAQALAAVLLCEHPADRMPCGVCRDCRLWAAGNHPDYRLIQPAEDKQHILIEQVRGLVEFLELSSQSGQAKIALLQAADTMTVNAANSLLKMLEEPPPGTLVMLVSARSAALPATIRSRCQTLRFSPPPAADGRRWLASQLPEEDIETLLTAVHGAPVRALEVARTGILEQRGRFFEDFLALLHGRLAATAMAGRWCKYDLAQVTEWLLAWTGDLIKMRWSSSTRDLLNPDLCREMSSYAERTQLRSLYAIYDEILAARGLLEASLNRQLVIENLLQAWQPVVHPH